MSQYMHLIFTFAENGKQGHYPVEIKEAPTELEYTEQLLLCTFRLSKNKNNYGIYGTWILSI